jgi:DnaK suppressor protein
MNIEVPEGYKPNDEEEYMNSLQLKYFKNKLLNWKKDLIRESLETLHSLSGDAWYSADLHDLAAFEIDKARELQEKNRQLKLINKIDEALQRIEEGEYGFCEETGEEIGLARLEARPIATMCVEAQERYEYYQKLHSDD